MADYTNIFRCRRMVVVLETTIPLACRSNRGCTQLKKSKRPNWWARIDEHTDTHHHTAAHTRTEPLHSYTIHINKSSESNWRFYANGNGLTSWGLIRCVICHVMSSQVPSRQETEEGRAGGKVRNAQAKSKVSVRCQFNCKRKLDAAIYNVFI